MKKLLDEFSKSYMNNCQTCWELDQSLMEELSFPKWKEVLINRSECMRTIFKENETFLDELQQELDTPLNAENAALLYNVLKELYYGAFDDLFIMRTLAAPLLSFYEKEKDYEKLTFLYQLLGFEYFEFYGRILGNAGIMSSVEYYQKAISMKSHYEKIHDPKIRKCIFTSYNNLIAPLGQINDTMKLQMFQNFYDVLDFWNTPLVQELDSENEEFLDCIKQIYSDVLFAEDFVEHMPKEFQEEFRKIIVRLQEKANAEQLSDEEGSMFRATIKCRLLDHEEPELLIEDLISHINQIEAPDFDDENQNTLLHILDYHNCACSIFDIFTYYNIPQEKQQEYMHRFVPQVTDIHTHIPFGFWTAMMDDLCAEWFAEIAPFITDPLQKRDLLMKLVISRQPLTYIHSLMVNEIAIRIAVSLLKNKPEFFLGILGFSSAAEISKNQEALRSYITECALLHDCGKCEIVEVINRQNRHLYDDEFAIIKKHPEKGVDMFKHDPAFAPYYDIILGHHKSYNGAYGYPESFDNTASPVKAVIDLITVADCIDAATDILGRNYSIGKDFDKIFFELKASAGIRYNPEIVELIAADKALYADLSYLTSEGRHEIYYRAYREILFR